MFLSLGAPPAIEMLNDSPTLAGLIAWPTVARTGGTVRGDQSRVMQNALAIRVRQFITSALVSAAMLYGSIFVVNWLSPKGCSTAFWPPSIHCRWDITF